MANFAHTLADTVRFYIANSTLARQQKLRNGNPALQHINLIQDDIEALVAILKALNENFD